MRGFENWVVIVIGVVGGIGREICWWFMEEGMRIVVFDVNVVVFDKLVVDFGVGDECVFCVVVDIIDYVVVKVVVDRGYVYFGCLDIFVNNVGWDVVLLFLKMEFELWDKIIVINFKGFLNLYKVVLLYFIFVGGGKIVNVVFDVGCVGLFGEFVYFVCKGGLIVFFKMIVCEIVCDNVCVNVVCFGLIDMVLLCLFIGEGEYG